MNNFNRVCEIRDSSNIMIVEYSTASGTIRISFSDYSVYEYYNVHNAVFGDLVRADSVGQFFQTNIKPIYEFKKII